MSEAGPSTLSMIAAAGYAVVFFACLAASLQAGRSNAATRQVWAWTMIAVFFVLLAAMRASDLEETMRDILRDWLRENGNYKSRGVFQLPLTIGIAFAVGGILVWLARKWRRVSGRRIKSLLVAVMGVFAMIGFVALRNISFSPFDKLLYGPLKLNWVGDIGSALLVLSAALYYAYVVQTSPSSRGPSR